MARPPCVIQSATADPGAHSESARRLPAQAVFFAALLSLLPGLPGTAHAGRVDAERPPVIDRNPSAAPGYQVRCWQYGRLLFEERGVELDNSTTQGLKLSGLDRRKLPVMVTDTGNATCLVRRTPPPSKPGRND